MENALRSLLRSRILRLLRLLPSVNRGRLRPSVAEIEAGDDLGEDFPDHILLDIFFGA